MPIYLYLDAITLFFPLILSFDRKVKFINNWKFLWPGMFITAFFFVAWDIVFTQRGIWSFNPHYLIGAFLFNLPLEEVLFFLVVPFACVFTYASLIVYIKNDSVKKIAPYITAGLITVLLLVMVFNTIKTYTSITFGLTAAYLFLMQFIIKAPYMGRFYVGYAASLVPFLLMNGVLTALPIVSYNSMHNLGVRIYTIPIEDTMYSLLLLLMNVSFYEYFKQRSNVG